MTGHSVITPDMPLSGACDFCGCESDTLSPMTSEANPGVTLLICPECDNEYVHGGYDAPEDFF